MNYIKSANMPFRYDFELERLINYDLPEDSELEDLSSYIEIIDSHNTESAVNISISTEVFNLNFNSTYVATKLKSVLDNEQVNVFLGEKNEYFVIVDPAAKIVKVVKGNASDESVYEEGNKDTYNNTIYIYKRLSETETVMVDKSTMMYGVQEGDFYHEEFLAMDNSIGNINN